MKLEDALESLCEDCVDFPCYALRHRDRCLQYHTLKKVIEKQIPKKSEWSICKSCGTSLSFITGNLGCPQQHKIIYCWNCGQALDWSDIE